MIKKDNLKTLINLYLNHINKVGLDSYIKEVEGYKFDFVNNFQNNFNIEANNFYEMVDKSLLDSNLTAANFYFPKKMLLLFIKKDEIKVKKAFINLFDNNQDIKLRIDNFIQLFEDMMDKENKKNNRNDHTFLGLRFTSLLLSAMFPSKYYFIKLSEHKKLAKHLDSDFKLGNNKTDGEKYEILHKVASQINDKIRINSEIIKIHDSFVDKENRKKYEFIFKDENYCWITQDFIFNVGRTLKDVEKNKRVEKNKKIDNYEKNNKKNDNKKKEINTKEVKKIAPDIKFKKVDFIDFLNFKNFKNSLWIESNTINNPEKISIRKLIDKCKPTFWMIPNFQRYFDWKKNYAKELWESIFKNYYIGSFLLLENRNEPKLGVLPIMGAEPKDKNPEMIILDGQQRITSIFYAVMAPDSELFKTLKTDFYPKIYFYVNFKNLLTSNSGEEIIEIHNKKLSDDESFDNFLFPLYRLSDWQDWVKDFKENCKQKINSSDLNSEKKGLLKDNLDELRDLIQDKLRYVWELFEIPYIYLPDSMDLGNVADIFENINTKGKSLNAFDLLIARLYKYDIELRELWEATSNNYPNIKRYHKKIDKMPIYFFQSLSLLNYKSSSAKKADILNIYSNVYEKSEKNFEEDWKEISKYIDQAIIKLELLNDGFGVVNENSLPFAPTIPILAALLKVIENRDDKPSCYRKIKHWYWSAVFINAYSGSVDSQLTSDFKELKLWFDDDNKIPKVVKEIRQNIEYNLLSFTDISSWSNAQFRGIMSLVAMEGAKDFNTDQGMMNVRENDKDHIFPKSMKLKNINSSLNFTWLSKETNRKIKLADKPSLYIPMFINDKYGGNEDLFKKTLLTHFIDEEAYNLLKNDDFFNFIKRREQLIIKKIKELVGCSFSVKDQLQENPNNVLEKLEISIRDFIDRVFKENIGHDYWSEAIPQHIDNKISSRLKVTETAVPYAEKITKPRKKLDYLDMAEYSDIILNKNNWIYFEKYFENKENTASKFKDLCDFRNPVKHVRDKQRIVDLYGEAAIEWLTGIINSSLK
jgi:hypothetical protein